jgi:uncharacterized protein YdaU (DUF1376 family)
MSRPWMPLYVADYLADTTHLRALESGAYLHLIMSYWQRGSLPTDDRSLASIAKMTDREWRIAKPVLAGFFDANWKHKRIDEELRRATDVSAKRSTAGKQKGSKQEANAGANDTALADTRAYVPQSQSQEQDSSLRSESNPAPLSARERFDEIEQKLRQAAGSETNPSPGLMVLAPILGLIDQGADLEQEILPAIRAKPRPDARSWDYFVPQIQEFRARRQKAASAELPAVSTASGKPDLLEAARRGHEQHLARRASA